MRPQCTKTPQAHGCKRRAVGAARRRTGDGLTRALGVIAGLSALLWLVLRSGAKPSRLAYPCQRAALATSTGAFVGLGVLTAAATRRGLSGMRRHAGPTAVSVAVFALILALFAAASDRAFSPPSIMAPTAGYAPNVYLVNHARGVEPGGFGGVDDLVTVMGTRGFKWHRSAMTDVTSGPDGLIATDSVVLLKINAQWSQRGGTNTDVIRGVIRRVVEHPDGFRGEVIVADNGQGLGSLSRSENNAEDRSQSVVRVVNDFADEGWNVSARLWDDLRLTAVNEFEDGDGRSGYVVAAQPDAETQITLSYPKFTTPAGTCISFKRGVWVPEQNAYDPERLVVINMPVLKTHGYYAVTGAVKNHMGVVTRELSTNSHDAVESGGLGTFLADVRMPDLTILDCIWVLARPTQGPGAPYANASRRDQLVAGTDPIALDAWAVKNILIPQIIENGYALSNYWARQDPDNPGSMFRRYLDLSMDELLLAGMAATNDYRAVRLHVWTGDGDRDGDVDLSDLALFERCMKGPSGVYGDGCLALDGDGDGDIDLADVAGFQSTFCGSPQ